MHCSIETAEILTIASQNRKSLSPRALEGIELENFPA
jgi:hypothetical protein